MDSLDIDLVQAAVDILEEVREINQQRSGIELFQAYLEKGKITYLDQHKKYAVVQTEHLEKL